LVPKTTVAWKLLAKSDGKQVNLAGKNIKVNAVSEAAKKMAEGAGAKLEVIVEKSKVLVKPAKK
jgi:hypothetical protein